MNTGITPLTPAEVAAQQKASTHQGFIKRDLVALDVAANVILGGMPDETISSRLARDAEEHRRLGIFVTKVLDRLQRNHGALSQAGDAGRAEAVVVVEGASGVFLAPVK